MGACLKWWRMGCLPGLGSHIAWDTRLDGRLAQAIVSIQAVKGVEIGFAEEGAGAYGSAVQDTIHYEKPKREFHRGSNRAGGFEGGITNGEDVVVRGILKPISTLRRPLESVDLTTREPALAAYETKRRRGDSGRGCDRRGDDGHSARRRRFLKNSAAILSARNPAQLRRICGAGEVII